MSLFEMIFGSKKSSASIAKDRLMVTLSHERASNAFTNMDQMKQEIIEVIKKYVKVKKVDITSEKNRNIDMLAIDVTLDD